LVKVPSDSASAWSHQSSRITRVAITKEGEDRMTTSTMGRSGLSRMASIGAMATSILLLPNERRGFVSLLGRAHIHMVKRSLCCTKQARAPWTIHLHTRQSPVLATSPIRSKTRNETAIEEIYQPTTLGGWRRMRSDKAIIVALFGTDRRSSQHRGCTD
jgi:hypothetical protein